jgi:hypothetical protein
MVLIGEKGNCRFPLKKLNEIDRRGLNVVAQPRLRWQDLPSSKEMPLYIARATSRAVYGDKLRGPELGSG